jgi:superfamily II DNA or RNA helicase
MPVIRTLDRRRKLHVNYEAAATAEAAGCATTEELAALRAAPDVWVATVRSLLAETDAGLGSARHIQGPERDMVIADLSGERHRLADALERLVGVPRQAQSRTANGGGHPRTAGGKRLADTSTPTPVTVPSEPPAPPGPPALQASWDGQGIVLWGASPSETLTDAEDLSRLMEKAEATAIPWEAHDPVAIPSAGAAAAAVAAPIGAVLGWLVGVGTGQLAADASPSLRWLGEVAVWATRLVAEGRMVPALAPSSASRGGGRGTAEFSVRWLPATVGDAQLRPVASRMPGAVAVLDRQSPATEVCRAVLSAAVDAVCRVGAARLVAPAVAPLARSRAEVAEAVLARLDGTPFRADARAAALNAEALRRWAAPVATPGTVSLTVRLDPPEEHGGWLLTVEATGVTRAPLQVERALATASRAQAAEVETHFQRLERLLPALKRPGRHRGEVVLDGTEAWELLTATGPALVAAGFDVQVPAISPRRPVARLHLHAEAQSGPSRVGAQQLSTVRWSVLFDDVELDAAAIARLAAQARPLVRAKNGWVALDQADLQAAAAALADRAGDRELTGAAILRHAVGLEGSTLGGAVVDGSGWAVELMRGASQGVQPLPATEEFVGELRTYQAEARGWLDFLDRAGLGGCLALDMGLGKTPTVLAHLLADRGTGPVLVIAPPAVLGNWAVEAARFTPGLGVHIHHGPDRLGAAGLLGAANETDVILTTYGTAVRDIDALAPIEWRRVVLDEAQAVKNPVSEAARALRRLRAGSRLVLTGTPIENGLGDLWALLDFTNPGLVGPRPAFIAQLSGSGSGRGGEAALRALNGVVVFRRTKAEPAIAAELPDRIDEVDHCTMTPEQVGLYQAVIDRLLAVVASGDDDDAVEPTARKGHVLAAITALKQICNHPAAYVDDDDDLDGRSGKLARLDELVDAVFSAGERMLVFTHFARWAEKLAAHLTARTGVSVACYHGGLSRTERDRLVREFQEGTGAGALVLSLKAGGAGLNLTAANHVVLYDRWWNPAVEDQARDRAWRIGQTKTVVCHRLVCPGTVDERVEEVVAGKRRIADLVLPARSSLGDLGREQLQAALGLRSDVLVEDARDVDDEEAAA